MGRGRKIRWCASFRAFASTAACALISAPHCHSGVVFRPAQTIASDCGQYSSLKIDPAGLAHIACRDHVRSDLVYFKSSPSGAWTRETVDTDGDAGRFASLALTSDGRPVVAYLDFWNGQLKIAERTTSGWSVESVAGPPCSGWYCSLALDSEDRPHIAFSACASPALYFASRASSGAWTLETVDSAGDVGLYASLELWDNNPRISYYDRDRGHLKFAERVADGWSVTTVDDGDRVGLDTSLALDEAGEPHISYWDQKNGLLKYAFREGGVWHVETVDAEPYGGYESSLSLSGGIRVSYEGATGLRVAERIDGCWRIWKLDDKSSAVGYTSLAVDRSDNPIISYFRLSTQSLEMRSGWAEASARQLAGSNVVSPGVARSYQNGQCAMVDGIITSDGGHAGWWLEATDRSAALQIRAPVGCGLPARGDLVKALGMLETASDGSVRLQLCSFVSSAPAQGPKPLVVARAHHLADGLLCTVAGVVWVTKGGMEVGGMTLELPTGWSAPPAGAFAIVTGILRAGLSSTSITPRSSGDVIAIGQ